MQSVWNNKVEWADSWGGKTFDYVDYTIRSSKSMWLGAKRQLSEGYYISRYSRMSSWRHQRKEFQPGHRIDLIALGHKLFGITPEIWGKFQVLRWVTQDLGLLNLQLSLRKQLKCEWSGEPAVCTRDLLGGVGLEGLARRLNTNFDNFCSNVQSTICTTNFKMNFSKQSVFCNVQPKWGEKAKILINATMFSPNGVKSWFWLKFEMPV